MFFKNEITDEWSCSLLSCTDKNPAVFTQAWIKYWIEMMVCCQRYNQILSWCLQDNLVFLTLLEPSRNASLCCSFCLPATTNTTNGWHLLIPLQSPQITSFLLLCASFFSMFIANIWLRKDKLLVFSITCWYGDTALLPITTWPWETLAGINISPPRGLSLKYFKNSALTSK